MSNDLYALRIMDLKDFSDSTDTSESSSVALGFFDGVHSGHEQIINACVSFARSNGIQAILQTSFMPCLTVWELFCLMRILLRP